MEKASKEIGMAGCFNKCKVSQDLCCKEITLVSPRLARRRRNAAGTA